MLLDLIQNLQAFHIVIIENDFSYEVEAESILGKYLNLNPIAQQLLCKELTILGFEKLSNKIASFTKTYNNLQHKPEQDDLLPDNLMHYLTKTIEETSTSENADKLIAEIHSSINLNIEINSTLLKYGIYHSIPPHYESLLNEFSKSSQAIINYYKELPSVEEYNDFFNNICENVKLTKGRFSIAIIDKKLEEGTTNPVGREFMYDLLKMSKKKKVNNLLGIIFTSTPEDCFPNKYKDYFVREIKKGENNILDTIEEKLTLCAYAITFKYLKHNYISSSKNAFKIALMNQRNIKDILIQGNSEGISPFETLNYWFSLAQNFVNERDMYTNFTYAMGLTKFFNEVKLPNHPEETEISRDLKNINAFELFDFNINKKHLPISSGDVFEINGGYYVLVGQACDLLLRGDNRRGAKIAELIKAKTRPIKNSKTRKFEIKVDENNNKSVAIKNFKEEFDDEFQILEIEISSKNTELAEFKVLDLCMFNEVGVCKINLSDNPNSAAKSILPKEKCDYYFELQEYFRKVYAISNSYNNENQLPLLSDTISISSTDFIAEDNIMNFGLKRVARIKDRFSDSIYRQLVNYKGRIDLNLINYAKETYTNVRLKYSFVGEQQSESIITQSLWFNGVDKYFKISEITSLLGEKYNNILTKIKGGRLVLGSNHNQYNIEEDTANQTYNLTFFYFIKHANNFYNKSNINYRKLGMSSIKNPSFRYLDNNEEGEFFDKDGKSLAIEIINLSRGIRIQENRKVISLLNGVISISDEEE